MSSATRAALATAALVVLGAAVITFLYLGGWWVTKDSTDRQGEVNRHSYGYQQSARDELGRNIGEVNTLTVQIAAAAGEQAAALRGQRHALLANACRVAKQITFTGAPDEQEQMAFADANCSAGAVSPTSEIEES